MTQFLLDLGRKLHKLQKFNGLLFQGMAKNEKTLLHTFVKMVRGESGCYENLLFNNFLATNDVDARGQGWNHVGSAELHALQVVHESVFASTLGIHVFYCSGN